MRSNIQYTSLLMALAVATVGGACGDDDGVNPDGGPVTNDGGGTDGGMAGSDARLRVLHMSPGTPGVDVFANMAEPAAVENLEFPGSTAYLTLPAATYTFDVAPATMGVAASVLTIGDAALAADTDYTAVAYDGADGIAALLLADDNSPPSAGTVRVRAIHTANGVGQVDIWNITNPLAPSPLFVDLDFGAAADAAEIPAGQYSVGIDVDDDATPDLAFDLPSIPAGISVNVFAVNVDGTPNLVAQLNDAMSTTIQIAPRTPTGYVRVLHLSPDAPGVDVFAGDATEAAVTNLEFSSGTGFLALDASTYTFNVRVTGMPMSTPALVFSDVVLSEGDILTAVAYDEVASISGLAVSNTLEGLDAANIRVRAIHAAKDVGDVDIWNVTAGSTPAPLWENVPFGAVGDALDIPAGAYTIGIDVDNDATPDLTFGLPALPAGTVVNVYAVSVSATEAFLVAQLPDGTTARIDPNS